MQFPPKNILDSGCGEGYYTNYLAKQLPTVQFYGTDISKEAIRLAAKAKTDVQYIVASNQHLPFINNSLDMVLNIFSPIAYNEYHRVLKQNGILITVSNTSKHLQELKEILYDQVHLEHSSAKNTSQLLLVEEHNLSFPIHLQNQEMIQLLFQMTPYYYRTSFTDKAKLTAYQSLDVTTEFSIKLYKKSE